MYPKIDNESNELTIMISPIIKIAFLPKRSNINPLSNVAIILNIPNSKVNSLQNSKLLIFLKKKIIKKIISQYILYSSIINK